jgi:thiamine-phosphate pyrophosphorylase
MKSASPKIKKRQTLSPEQKTGLGAVFKGGRAAAAKKNPEGSDFNSTLRIIDANLNRCREGLRVVEDSLRFVLNDGHLYKKIRAIRHETDKILRGSYGALISVRDTFSDSGREMPEASKKELPGIVIANFKRAQESLRVLEEYCKTVFPEASGKFKKQRYGAYNTEKAVFLKYGKIFNDKR